MEETKLNEYIDTIQRYGAHNGLSGLGTASFDNEEEVEDEERKKDPKYELYKHFVKPGYKKVNKKLIVFDEEDNKGEKEEKKEKKEKKHKKEKKDKKEKKHKKHKKEKKEKKKSKK